MRISDGSHTPHEAMSMLTKAAHDSALQHGARFATKPVTGKRRELRKTLGLDPQGALQRKDHCGAPEFCASESSPFAGARSERLAPRQNDQRTLVAGPGLLLK